jgi:DNA-binding NtrC family response regulator
LVHGAFDYIVKPFEMERLREVLEAAGVSWVTTNEGEVDPLARPPMRSITMRSIISRTPAPCARLAACARSLS